jgi:uncharacterized protein YacL
MDLDESLSKRDEINARLLNVARVLQARILSTDVNVCRAARVQGLQALNLNDLAKALRSQLNAGDEVELHLTKEGKDPTQGVGYLPDGTMIVVNQGREFVGKTVVVTVSGTVPTSGPSGASSRTSRRESRRAPSAASRRVTRLQVPAYAHYEFSHPAKISCILDA